MVDRPDVEIHGLETPEGALHLGQVLVRTHGILGLEQLLRHRGAQHVDAIKPCLGCDRLCLARVGEGGFRDLDLEVFGHLEAAQQLADPQADLVLAS